MGYYIAFAEECLDHLQAYRRLVFQGGVFRFIFRGRVVDVCRIPEEIFKEGFNPLIVQPAVPQLSLCETYGSRIVCIDRTDCLAERYTAFREQGRFCLEVSDRGSCSFLVRCGDDPARNEAGTQAAKRYADIAHKEIYEAIGGLPRWQK